jgi:TonB family protein
MDSVVAVVFLVTLSIGLWQWMQAPADAAKDAQPSPVTVELENVFLRPLPVSEAEASRKAEARSSRVLAATTSLVKAVIGSAAPSRGESALGSPGSAAAEPVRRREEPVAEQRRPEPTSAPSEDPPAMAESAPAISSPPAAASAPAASPLASEAPAEDNRSDALSGAGLAGMLLQKVIPVYPAAARREGVQGQVVLKAVIGKDGSIAELRPMQGPQALTAAAMEAVQHWRFRPYELKGKPVEVETDIRVNFALPKNR